MKGIIVGFALVISLTAIGQNEVDALRYSFHPNSMTGRSAGMGGAFGALGADFSSFFNNPGGIGQFKRAGLDFGMVANDQSSAALYMGETSNNAATKFGIQNFGIVGNQSTRNKDWSSVNFGFAYGKINNFNQQISIDGKAVATSLLDVFALQASGMHPDDVTDAFPFGAGLAYQTFAINPIDTSGINYAPAITSGEVRQQKNIDRSGAQANTAFGAGANYRNIFSVGVSVNFMSVRFRERSTYTETYGLGQDLNTMAYVEDLNSTGTGVSIKIGAIYKPTKWLRIGSAFHSKTYLSMREIYSASMNTTLIGGNKYDYTSPDLSTDYSIRTPARMQMNAAFVLGKFGVIAADYEYANFNRIRMNGIGLTNNYDYDAENETIKTIYKGTHRVSVGAEFRWMEEYYTRIGAAYQQSPFVNNVAENSPWLTYSAGLGFKRDHFYIDFATSFSQRQESYYLYDPSRVEETKLKHELLNMILSFGIKY